MNRAERPPKKESEHQRAFAPWAWAALTIATSVYLLIFATSGGSRGSFYQTLATGYLLIPDQLLLDLWDASTGLDAAGILDRIPLLLVASYWLTGSASVGYLLLPDCVWRDTSRSERFAYAAAVGLQITSLYTLAIGLAGLLSWSVLFWLPMTVAIGGVAWRGWRRHPWRLVQQPTSAEVADNSKQSVSFGWLLLAFPAIGLTLLLAALPPWEFDVREYHMQVPKEWLLEGRIGFLPHNVYGNMPLGAEMHLLANMAMFRNLFPEALDWWHGALAGKLVMASFAWIGAIGLNATVRRYVSATAGAIAAAVYLATPWIIDVSSIGMNEGVIAAYGMLSLAAILRGDESDSPRTWLALGGFLAGASVACKYTSLVLVVFPLTCIVAWLAVPKRAAHVALFLGMMLAACGPWFAKNWMLAGNPTYPLLYSVFGGQGWDEATDRRWHAAHSAPRDANGNRFSVQQLISAGRTLAWESDKLSPLLWPLALFGIAAPLTCPRARRLRRVVVLILAVTAVLWWLVTHRIDRFLVPALPLVAVLGGIGVQFLWSHRVARRVTIVALTIGTMLNLLYAASPAMTGDKRIFAQLNPLRRDERARARSHPARIFLNDHVPPGKKALIIGDAEVYDCEVPVVYHTCWNPCPLEIWFKERPPSEWSAVFREQGISHVFIHWPEIQRYRSPGNYGFTSFVTPEFVRGELVERHHLLRRVPLRWGDDYDKLAWGEMFEVVELKDEDGVASSSR